MGCPASSHGACRSREKGIRTGRTSRFETRVSPQRVEVWVREDDELRGFRSPTPDLPILGTRIHEALFCGLCVEVAWELGIQGNPGAAALESLV